MRFVDLDHKSQIIQRNKARLVMHNYTTHGKHYEVNHLLFLGVRRFYLIIFCIEDK